MTFLSFKLNGELGVLTIHQNTLEQITSCAKLSNAIKLDEVMSQWVFIQAGKQPIILFSL